jgi:hypothetical protein
MLADVAAAALYLRLRDFELRAEGDGALARQADDGQAVRPVVRNLEFDDAVVRADDRPDVVAGLAVVLLQDEDAVLDSVGEIVQVELELLSEQSMPFESTPRSLPFSIFTPPGRRDLCSATGARSPARTFCARGDDLDGRALPDVDLTNPQVVAVGMPADLDDAPTTTFCISSDGSCVSSTLEPESVILSAYSFESALISV